MKTIFALILLSSCAVYNPSNQCKWIGVTVVKQKDQTLQQAYFASNSWKCYDKNCFEYNVIKSWELAKVNHCKLVEVIVKHPNGYEVIPFSELKSKIF